MEFDSHWGGQNQKKGTATYTQPLLTMFLVIAALALVGVRNRWCKTLATAGGVGADSSWCPGRRWTGCFHDHYRRVTRFGHLRHRPDRKRLSCSQSGGNLPIS